MKLKNTKGQEVVVDLTKRNSSAKEGTKQFLVAQIAEDIFPFETQLENFTIPGSRLSLDIFFPSLLMAIEVQGQQHQEYIPHFHGEKSEKKFTGQKHRDMTKSSWCELNEIVLIEIFPEEKENDIREKIIKSCISGRAASILRHRKL